MVLQFRQKKGGGGRKKKKKKSDIIRTDIVDCDHYVNDFCNCLLLHNDDFNNNKWYLADGTYHHESRFNSSTLDDCFRDLTVCLTIFTCL